MAQVTVRDITSTLRTLKRLENYASRHMQNVPISQVNENVREARDLLRDNVTNFESMDVQDLTPDTTDLEARLDRATNQLSYYQSELEEEMDKKKKNRNKWYVQECRDNVDYYTEQVEEMEFELDA